MTKIYSFEHSFLYSPPAPMAEIHVYPSDIPENEFALIALIDSGADATILPISVLQKIKAPLVRIATVRGVHDIGIPTPIYRVSIRIGEYVIHRVEAVSSKQANQVLLGRDVLEHLRVTLDGPAAVTEISE